MNLGMKATDNSPDPGVDSAPGDGGVRQKNGRNDAPPESTMETYRSLVDEVEAADRAIAAAIADRAEKRQLRTGNRA